MYCSFVRQSSLDAEWAVGPQVQLAGFGRDRMFHENVRGLSRLLQSSNP